MSTFQLSSANRLDSTLTLGFARNAPPLSLSFGLPIWLFGQCSLDKHIRKPGLSSPYMANPLERQSQLRISRTLAGLERRDQVRGLLEGASHLEK